MMTQGAVLGLAPASAEVFWAAPACFSIEFSWQNAHFCHLFASSMS
jgi:hypothetical protein